jgi:hypothetical protein
MTPLDAHEDRIRRLEEAAVNHQSRIAFLEDLMARVVALQAIVVDLLQRQRRDDEANGR